MKFKNKLVILLLVLSLCLVGCQNGNTDENVENENATGEVFEGVGEGRNGDVKVAVTINEDEIVAIELVDHEETDGYWEQAYEGVSEEIISNQSLDVDVVTGATLTSHAILEGTAKALEEAGIDPNEMGYTEAELPDPSELLVETGANKEGVRNFEYTTQGNTCSTKVTFVVNEDDMTVEDLIVYDGCDGNARGFCALADGEHIDDIIERFEGIPCHASDGSSCPDQVAKALDEARFIIQGERLLAHK